MDKVNLVTIGIFEEHETVLLIPVRLGYEVDAFSLQLRVCLIEIVNRDCDVPHTWRSESVSAPARLPI